MGDLLGQSQPSAGHQGRWGWVSDTTAQREKLVISMSRKNLLHAAHRHIQGAARVCQGVDGLQQGAADALALEGRQHQHLAHAHAHAVWVAEEVVHRAEAALHAIQSPMSPVSRAPPSILLCCESLSIFFVHSIKGTHSPPARYTGLRTGAASNASLNLCASILSYST